MKLGIPRETFPGEARVAVTPGSLKRLASLGLTVQVEAGAGAAAGFPDEEYAKAGAALVPTAAQLWATSDIVLKVRPPGPVAGGHEADLLASGALLMCFVWPGQNRDILERLAARKASVLAMDCVPRITRAQKMDALSAMANLAGYRAVLEAAHYFGRFIPAQMTAAGKSRPAKVFVIGAGVAGLSAIATARSLGAEVSAFDTRASVRDQIESLGARFVELAFDEQGEGGGGYAKEMSAAYLAAEHKLIAEQAADADLVVTTALIPGKPAPELLTAAAVMKMRPGSVIVDLAAEQGGNCPLTERGVAVQKHGVTILGFTDLPSRMARQASELYATTLINLLSDVVKDGALAIDLDDEVVRGALVLHQGASMWPPPPRASAATPQGPAAGAATTASQAGASAQAEATRPPNPKTAFGRAVWPVVLTLLACLFGASAAYAPPAFISHLTVFVLACIVGWHVVWSVTPALHTPLMSVTNAISGIILIGGMLVMPGGELTAGTLLGAAAVLVAAINVAGGFLVTQRMLRMFQK